MSLLDKEKRKTKEEAAGLKTSAADKEMSENPENNKILETDVLHFFINTFI